MAHRLLVAWSMIGVMALAGCGGSRTVEKAPDKKPASGQPAVEVAAEKPPMITPTQLNAVAVPDDQPPAPPLPENIDLTTDDLKLDTHARIAAREEVANQAVLGVTVEQRRDFIFRVWRPLMTEKQAFLRKIQDDRAAVADYETRRAARRAKQDRELDEMEARYQVLIRAEREKTVPIKD